MGSERNSGACNALSGPYRKVHALMIRWKDIDDDAELEEFKTQLNDLAAEFRQYRFDVEHYEIESESPSKKLSQRLHDFSEYAEEGALLVVYYGGHGRKDDDSRCLWVRDNPEDTEDAENPYVNWSNLQGLFFDDPLPCHVLFLLDCCYAGASATVTSSRNTVEAIVAAGFEQVAPLRGSDSFTAFLAKVLKDCRRRETPVVASVLARRLSALLNSPQVQSSFNTRVTPHYIPFHSGDGSILLAPAEQQGSTAQLTSISRTVRASVAPNAPSPMRATICQQETVPETIQGSQQTISAIRSRIKSALWFRTINHRESHISDAHTSTLSWILDDESFISRWFLPGNRPVSEFRSWLQEDGKPIFWISGKYGSGKSTLMKWIYQNPRLRERLRVWAKKKELLLCHFFFFERGETLQKSREGLLRSILFQLFEAKEELVEIGFPEAFRAEPTTALLDVPVVWETLKSALKRVLAFTAKAGWSVCMFIDGLDEYRNDEQTMDYTEEELEMTYDGDEEDAAWGLNALISDNHREVVKFFTELASQPGLKMCLSSRETPAIDLELSGFPRFRLHEHTRDDIQRYVSERLSRPALRLAPEDRDFFVFEIVDKARGVFFWVRLVVDLVSERRITGEDVPRLRELLRSVPAQLGGKTGLYMSMIQSINKDDRLELSRLLRLLQTTATWNPLTAVVASFALRHYNQSHLDVNKVETMPVCLRNPLNLGDEREAFRLRLRSRFYGLFECEAPGYEVNFSHQTVKEFFTRKSVLDELHGQLNDEHFDATLALLAGHIMLVKATGKDMVHVSKLQFGNAYIFVADAMHYAKLADSQSSDQQAYIGLVDELDRTMATISTLITPCGHGEKCHWPHWEPTEEYNISFVDSLLSRGPGWPHTLSKRPTYESQGFLGYAALGTLLNYLRVKLGEEDDEPVARKASGIMGDFLDTRLFWESFSRRSVREFIQRPNYKLYFKSKYYAPLGYYLGRPAVAKLLFEFGANSETAAWKHFLLMGYFLFVEGFLDFSGGESFQEKRLSYDWKASRARWVEMLGLFLEHGLNPHRRVRMVFSFRTRGKMTGSYISMVGYTSKITQRWLNVDLPMALEHFFGGNPEYNDVVRDLRGAFPAILEGAAEPFEDILGAVKVQIARRDGPNATKVWVEDEPN